MSTTEGAVVEQSDALEYDYSYGNTAVEDGGWDQEQAWDDGTYSYGYEYDEGAMLQSQEGGNLFEDHAPEDAAWAQDSGGTETALEEWQWVEDPESGGYYYNSVTGEARWDDQAAVGVTNSQALVEYGYQNALAQSTAASSGAAAADQSVLTDVYGEESYVFTADDGTVWRYDAATGNYVQQPEEQQKQEDETATCHPSSQLAQIAESEFLQLDPSAGAPWQRVDTEQGSYYFNPHTQESSWDLPQLGEGSAAVSQSWAPATECQDDGMNDGDTLQQSDGSVLNPVTDDTGGQSSVTVLSTHGSAPAPERDVGDERKDTGRNVAVKTTGGRSLGGDSGDGNDGSCRDQESTGDVSKWSAEKLREVSKTFPGEWLVSDFLLEHATEDYDRMLELDDSEIEAIKSKGTSRIIRSLVGPEEGEDDEEDEVSLPSREETGESDSVLASAGAAEIGGTVQSMSSVATVVPSANAEESSMENLDGGEGQGENRRRSILGLTQASAGSKEGLGPWKPGFAMDGSAYFVHQETGESAWTYPVCAWEVKANQLRLLTPRAPLEVGRGVCRLRETETMRKNRISYRWKAEQQRAKEAVRRREDPTPAEAAEAAVEGIIAAIERRERRERRLAEHNARVKERARWHPSTGEYLMQRLVFPSTSKPPVPAAGPPSNEMEPGVIKIITDADFVDVKLTQAGSAIRWGPEAVEQTPLPAPIKVQPKTSSFAKLRLDLPAMIHGGLAHAPFLPRLPSVQKLARVRSLDDLKRELNAGFVSGVGGITQGKSAMNLLQFKIDTRGKGALKTAAAAEKVVTFSAGEKSPPAGLTASLKSVALTDLSPPIASSDAPVAGATAASISPASLPSERQEAAIQRSEEDRPGPDKIRGNTNGSSSTGVAIRGGEHEASTSPRSNTATTPRTPPPQAVEATSAAGLKREQGHTASQKREDGTLDTKPSPSHPSVSEEPTRAPKSTAVSIGPTINTEDIQAMHGDGQSGEDKLGRTDAPLGSVALAAVASLDEQVRGLRGKLALRIEGGDTTNSSGRTASIGAEALVAAKRSLARVGKAIGFQREIQSAPAPAVRDSAKLHLPPPDTATVTLRLACMPPPFNLLTTVRVKDPTTGKDHDHEILTSVLRDAWEKVIVRDVATAGGVDARQVLIEEVRRDGGPFPLGISRRQEDRFRVGGTLPSPSDSALPFRPERCDDTYRNLTRTTPTAPTGELQSRSAPQLGLETGAFFDGGKRSTAAKGRSRGKGRLLKEPLASSTPLPSAGIRAVLTRRLLSGSRIKRLRRRGNAVSAGGGRSESGGGSRNPNHGATEVAEMGTKSEPDAALTVGVPSGLRHARKGHNQPTGGFPLTDTATSIGKTSHAAASDTPTLAYEEKSVPGPEEMLQRPGANEESPDNGGRSVGEHTPPPGKKSAVPISPNGPNSLTAPDSVTATTTTAVPDMPPSDSGGSLPRLTHGGKGERARASGKGSVVPLAPTGGRPPPAPGSVVTTTAAPKGPASTSAEPFPRIPSDHFPTATSMYRQDITPSGLDGEISRGNKEVAKRINFADKTTADDIAVGIGAGNRDDWGILGRAKKNGGRALGTLRHVEGMVFDPVNDGRKRDLAVQQAIEDTLRGDHLMKTWQAKDSVMKAMDRRERIPTLHELKLAGRVERARALFGPGGYLPQTLTRKAAQDTPYSGTATAGAEEAPTRRRHEVVERRQDICEDSSPKAAGGKHDRRLSATNPREDIIKMEDQRKPAFSPSKREFGTTSGPLVRQAPPPPLSNTTGDGMTTVTLTIVGGGTGSRSFAYLPHGSKTNSEAVARSIALQAGAEGSDLLRGGLTHATLSAHWRPAGRGRVMNTWEGYWCHIISPAFFGRSIRSRHVTKAEARRRREDAARQQEKADFLASEEEEKPETPIAKSINPLPSRRVMSLIEQLEQAELQYQELLAEGLADGRRLNPKQYMAMKTRDRAVKKVLLRRKLTAKRKSGGLTRTKFPYRRLPSDELKCWKEEIMSEDKARRTERRAENAVRREERAEDSRKRRERNKLKAWILRHLVASNGDADLMAKAIALHHDEENLNGVGSASKGAVGRESFISGRNMRPGGRFAYGLEASAEEMKQKDATINAQRQFEQDADSLLREIFRVVHTSLHASLLPSSAADSPVAGVDEQSEHPRVRIIKSTSNKSDPPVTVSDKSRGGSGEEVNSGGDGAGGGGSLDGTRSVLSADNDTATGDENNEVSPLEGSRTRTPAGRTASVTTPISATIKNTTSYDALPPAQHTVVEQSTPVTSSLRCSAGGPGGRAGGGRGGRGGRGGGNERVEDGEEGATRNSVRNGEELLSVPRSELLRALRESGLLRRKAMTSDAVRPILCDRDFTEAFLLHPCATSGAITENELALFGSVTAEVDRWYKRVRATLDPVRAVSEARVKSFETRKERSRGAKVAREKDKSDGLAPSDAWRRQLNVSRKTNRGDGREWSRFHHHVLIRTAPHIPLYCCLCRRRKWDEARVARLKAEHAVRASWGRVLNERQEILEPMVQAEIRAALNVDGAIRDRNEGAWAVMHCLKSLVAAVPGRVESLKVADDAVDSILEKAMRESCSFEEWTRKRRIAALAKLRALEGLQTTGSHGRRRSRRVSVGPTGFAVTPEGAVTVSSLVPRRGTSVTEFNRRRNAVGTVSSAIELSAGAKGVVGENAVAAGMQRRDAKANFAVPGGVRRGFAEFSDQAQATARGYYSAPQGALGAEVRGTVAWDRLTDAWFQAQPIQGDVWEDEKIFALEACVVEVLEGERRKWERCEWERRAMFTEDELQRRGDESLRRSAEAAPRERQEAGQRAFCAVLDTMERRSQSLARLRWEFIADFQDMQDMTCRVRDAATGRRYVCRLLPCRGQEEVAVLLREAYRVQEIRNPSLVKVHSAHPHRIATYDERGVQTTGGEIVLVLLEFCPGGSIEDHLGFLRGETETAVARGGGGRDRNRSQTNGGSLGTPAVGPRSKTHLTTGADSVSRAEDGEGSLLEGSIISHAIERKTGVMDRVGTIASRVPARRLEVWVRQVAHGLSALHADGGIHRNINAGNVYLDETRRAKLGGYQWLKVPSRRQASPGPPGMPEGFGSVTTAPPEFELCGETSAKGDMWSLGCALFKWTTGKEFAYLAAGARLQDVLHLVPPRFGNKIKTALFMCLQRDPGVRVSSLDLWNFMSATGDERTTSSTPTAAVAQ